MVIRWQFAFFVGKWDALRILNYLASFPMYMKRIFLALGCWWMGANLQAQTDSALSLRQCVDYAWQNSLQVQRSGLAAEQAALGAKQAQWAQYPSVNGSLRHGVNFGRSIDPTSYEFVNQVMQSTNVSLNLTVPLYNGLQLRNNIQQQRVNVDAAGKDLEQSRNDVALSIAQMYLSVLLAEENVQLLREQNKVTQAQYEQTLKLIKAGNLPDNNRYDLEAQLARNEQNIVQAENSLQIAYVNLKLVMNWDPNKPLRVQRVEIPRPESTLAINAEDLYAQAAEAMPSVAAARLRERSAQWGIKVAKGALQPSVALFSSVSTNYSSLGQRFTGDTVQVNQVLTGNLNGSPFSLTIPTSIPKRERSPYFAQLGDNFTQAVGLSVQVPIFNGYQARINIQRAELSARIAQLNTRQLENQLKSDVQRALADAQGAAKRLQASEKTLEAVQRAADNTKKRYDLGLVNGFEWTSVQNNVLTAQSNLLQAQYDLLFRIKILDYYQGKGVE